MKPDMRNKLNKEMIYDMDNNRKEEMRFYNVLTGKKYFPNWEKSFSQLGTYVHRLMNLCSSAHEPMFIGSRTYVLRMMMMIVMVMGVGGVWGQKDYSGVYYIANAIWNGSNTSSPYYWYSADTPEYNWYLVPAADPRRDNKEDAYYSSNYSSTSGDSERPFLTTYRTNRDNNSIWIVKKTGNLYYIIHALTGKYVKYEPPYTAGNVHRKAIHLETWTDSNNDPGDVFKYEITEITRAKPSITGFNIKYTGTLAGGSHRHFNPAGDNWEYYYGKNDKSPYSLGMVGFYTTDADNIKGGLWPHEDAKSFLNPTISDKSSDNKVTITMPDWLPAGYNLRYTFGSDNPTATTTSCIANNDGSAKMIDFTEPGTLKVVIERYGVVLSEVVEKTVIKVVTPSIISDGTDITINCATDGATIYYTTDGSDPLTSETKQTYSDPLSVSSNLGKTIRAIAVNAGCFNSDESTPLTVTAICSMPTISFSNSNGEITLECSDADAIIYYTLDGSVPDPTQVGGDNPTKQYDSANKPTISATTTVKAIATKAGSDNSEVASLTIVLTPTLTLEGTPYTYDGTAKEPTVSSVKVGETIIGPDEYTVSYSNNINAGSSATVTISDNEGGDYYVAGSTTFTINPFSIGSGTTPATGITIDVTKSGDNYVVTVKHGETTLTEGTDYTKNGSGDAYSYTVTVTGMGNYTGSAQATYVAATPGYYAIHQNGKGYLRVNSANVTLTNDGNFRYADLFSDEGNSIWYVTPTGYLQNGYFYLNVINGRTLCLSVEPETRWQTEEIAGDTHGKMHLKTGGLYLCNDNNTITLSASPSAYYNACPITITEKSWSEPSASELTLQSPQQVTYLRAYYTQKMDYEFYNDAGTKVSEKGKDRRVYAKLYYESGGDNKGTNWDINTTSGVIYNKLTSNVTVTATYRIEPADPIASGLHSTPGTKSIKYTLQPKSITPVAEMNYLLFSIKAGDNDRYPYDDGIAEGGDVKPDGKGGTGASSVLTDPDTPNSQISWKLTVDEEGFYTFQNASTNKYLYYDETPHASSDYGALKLGSSPSDNRYKFRLYKTSNTDYGTCYQIIPYSRQFAVYKNDGVATGFYASLNNNNYKSQTPKVISLYKADDNSQWCIYKYEAEYRVKKDFSIKVETSATANATGAYLFSSEGWYAKCIKESPKTGNGQNGLVINGTYKNKNNINYQWTVTGIGDYITISDGNNTAGTNSNGTWTITTTGNDNNKKLKITVTTLPLSTVSGIVKLRLSGGESPNVITSGNADEKSVGFTILGDGTLTLTEISSLAEINNTSGIYKLTQDVTYSSTNKPTVSTFSGILDCDGHTISGLNAPLFETLTNGTVRNVNLSGVNIPGNSGPTGAIAGTANGGSRIYNVGILDGSVGSSGNVCGGLVGLLDGSARVINCFSYATVTGGTKVGGIVGENKYKTTAADARTMVMNCMFYGNITGGNNKAPIYNGEIISNVGNTGVGNYNYFLADATFTGGINTYNCALMAEKRFLQRFEFYRHLLNGHRELAGWWATGTFSKNEMAKWVMEPSQIGSDTPYPILKAQGKYPSVVNIDAENATTQSERNKGGKLGTLTVNIQMGDGEVYNRPSEAAITTSQLTLNITDKDPDRFNFNYYKVQLPYYNDVGTKNYNGNRVVTGWKIVSITGGTPGSFTTGDDASASVNAETGEVTLTTPYNFADRNCTNKDLYGTGGSNRIFNQGAYWDVPEGVTAITIEPYWAKCVYLADANADVVYNSNMGTAYSVPNVGGGKIYNNGTSYSIAGENQLVYTTMSDAISSTNSTGLFVGIEGDANKHTVYDYAVVLVGNYHNYNSIESSNSKPYTVTSIDLDGDNEPDYSYILRFDSRKGVHPVKYDFLNLIGLGMAQKSTGSTGSYNFGIMQPMSWFEVTNTALFRVTQLEYEHKDRVAMPLILHGGVIEQWVSGQSGGNGQQTTYIHVGSNVWFKEFHLGCHQDATLVTKHPPVSVTGGDYNEFYLTGLYSAAANCEDNAECYINGGRFGKVAGTGIEGIGKANGADNTGNIVWQIQNADIDEFYGGGINAAKPMQGNITTVITGSHVKRFCGGPKFGDMNTGKTVHLWLFLRGWLWRKFIQPCRTRKLHR